MPFRETTRGPYDEEVTDEDYLSDDHPIEIDSDSGVALLMTDDEFEATNPHKIDDALQDIIEGLKKAASGFEELRGLVPSPSSNRNPQTTRNSATSLCTTSYQADGACY